MKKFAKTLTCTLIMAMLLSLNALAAAPVVTEMEGAEVVVADSGEKLTSATYENEAIVKGGQYMIFVVDGDLPTADSILYINQAEADEAGVVTFENVYPKVMMNSNVMISGTGLAAPVTVAQIKVGNDDYKKGDINCDELITAADAQQILRSTVGLSSLIDDGDLPMWVIDINGDELITAADAQQILRHTVGLSSLLDTDAQ